MTLPIATRLPTVAWGISLAIASLAFAGSAVAQDKPSPSPEAAAADGATTDGLDQTYAMVDGEAITMADMAIAARDYAQQLGRPDIDIPIPELLEAVIDMRVVAKAAEEAGVDEQDTVKRMLAFDRARTLRNEYLRSRAVAAVTDEAVRARFDEETAKFEPDDELHLFHILVENEDEAKAIIVDLEAGGDFAAIAKEKSKDPGSGPNGGDLDFVPRGLTVPEFEEAAFALDVGETTKEPVKSDFGWHVIKVEESRKTTPPEFSTQQERIKNEMLRDFVTNEVESLRAAANIEITLPEAAPAVAAPEGADKTAPDADGAATPAQ